MRDVVIVGGGLTGLSAAYTLSHHDIDVTLIEVKRRLGGTIQSITEHDTVFDSGALAIRDDLDKKWLGELGLTDALYPLGDDSVAFKQGSGQLIDALKQHITATRLMRMAVSSIGELENDLFSICMENGLLFDARALILAVPARYAERMFYGYITPITEHLLDYHYDTVQRVSMLFATDQLPDKLNSPPDMTFLFTHRTNHPDRVPDGHTLLQFGVRIDPARYNTRDSLVDFLCEVYNLPPPVASHIGFCAEADPVSCYDDAHHDRIGTIREMLPERIALVGSDYTRNPASTPAIASFNERIQQGIAAANQMLASL